MASSDYVQRAATEQRTQEMAAQARAHRGTEQLPRRTRLSAVRAHAGAGRASLDPARRAATSISNTSTSSVPMARSFGSRARPRSSQAANPNRPGRTSMRTLILVLGLVLTLGGCASNAPQKAWGKPGVSKMDYALDVGMCAGLAATQSGGNGAHIPLVASTARRLRTPPIHRSSTRRRRRADLTRVRTWRPPSRRTAPIPDMASADYAQRAASQQRAQEMTAQRARAESLKGCLVERGYQEFTLTAEQRAHLATLTRGTQRISASISTRSAAIP